MTESGLDDLVKAGPGRRGHALVVGGTGMLADLSLALADRWRQVSVLARPGARLAALAARRVNLSAVGVDYTRAAALARALSEAKAARGEIDLAVCWVHTHARDAMDVIAASLGAGARVVHVRSSEAAEAREDEPHRALRQRHPGLGWQAVRLGFKVDLAGGVPRARWLTHAEISAGVLAAVDSGVAETWVGLAGRAE